jgi:hypothetical protein
MDNAGDRIVAEAIGDLFRPLILVDYAPSLALSAARRLAGPRRLFRLTCLGGGTLIFADTTRGWGAALLKARTETEGAFAAGTGVIDPEFRAELSRRFQLRPLSNDAIAAWIDSLRSFDLLSVRGPHSQRILAERGLTGVEVIGDPSVHFAWPEVTPKPGARRIGLNVANRSYFYGDANRSVVERLADLARLLRGDGFAITLFPMGPEDLAPTAELRRLVGDPKIAVFPDYRRTSALFAAIAAQDLFVGVRLHSVAAAVCTYTPAIMLGYQPKNADYMASLGLDDFHLRIDALEPGALFERLRGLHETGLAETQARQFAGCQALRARQRSFRHRVLARAGVASVASGAQISAA